MDGLNTADDFRQRLLARLCQGLPLVAAPYAALASDLGVDEAQVIAALGQLVAAGAVGRFGVIVDHQSLGFTANAMVVWAVPEDVVEDVGRRVADAHVASLCYRRPTAPGWPYTLYTMIHGRTREDVLARVALVAQVIDLPNVAREVLFTTKRFKQTGARYGRAKREVADA